MGSLFRSEEMTLCQLFLHADTAYTCISELGELGLVQFRDTVPDTSAFQRKFVNEIRRCDEMERKLRYLENEIKKDVVPIAELKDNPEAPAPREMIDLEATFEKMENEMRDVNSNAEQLKKNLLELTELKHILRKTQGFFDEASHDPSMTEENIGLLGEEGLRAGGMASQGLRLGFLAGVILRERMPSFELMLWRACRGNVFLKQSEIENPLDDPLTGEEVLKSVFIIFFQGDQLKSRVKKICEAFHATLYPCPDSQSERREMAISVMTRVEDLQTVLNQTQEHRQRLLSAAARCIRIWFVKVHKIKSIYHILNYFNLDVTAKCMIGECWCAIADLERIQEALRCGAERSNSSVQPIVNRMTTAENPPTFFRTNKFTIGFQNLVDAYGVAKYREINPALFAIITFPFLFAVMFGDAGHGILMTLFAVALIIFEKNIDYYLKHNDDEISSTFFSGRYIILLMGIFSIYTGFVYNDVFSKSLNIFGSAWYPNSFTAANEHMETYQLLPTKDFSSAYPIGLDPTWQFSVNKISFTNSIKMKMSIIFGVIQMMFGVVLNFLNKKFFGDTLSIYCEFIPQVIFMMSIFGYLVCLIFAKWLVFDATTSGQAPSLLLGLINMFMLKTDSTWFPGQSPLQIVLVLLALISVPWMLCIKPYILNKRHKSAESLVVSNGAIHNDTVPLSNDQSKSASSHDHHGSGGQFDMTEIFVYQCIHTIEYCLGCISNTASYLRLWALSLAHAQLSDVLWKMVLTMGLKIDSFAGSVVLVFIFFFWSGLTMGVLLLMEGLSAFLHALRLHWIEFQNKFYDGSGHAFVPFSFEYLHDSARSSPDQK